MLNQIKQFFDEHMKLAAPEDSSAEKLKVTCAALFLEMMMMMDDEANVKEHQAIIAILRNNFSLSAEQAETLIELAEQQRQEATDYYRFISLINKHYNQEQKIQLIESFWKIAFIDGVLDVHEEYFVRKIANLLYVPHSAFVLSKNKVNSKG